MVPSRSLPVVVLAALAAVAAPVQAAPPADAFCVILIEGVDGFRLVRVTVDEETNLTEREALFGELDLDADGRVTTVEGERFRRRSVEARSGPFTNSTHHLQLLVETGDGSGGTVRSTHVALHHAVWRQVGHTFHKQDHTQPWPVEEPIDLETQEVREASFAPGDAADRVVIDGGEPIELPPNVAIEYVVVRAPPGWTVARVQGYTYEGWIDVAPNATEADIPSLDTKRPYTIAFERQGPAVETVTQTVAATPAPDGGARGASAPAPALAALALAAAAAVALRRRL